MQSEENHPEGPEKNEPVLVATDSVGQVPGEDIGTLGIPVIPYIVNVGEQSFLDGADFSATDMYRAMRETQVMPTTSAPSLGEFVDFFTRQVKAGFHRIFYVSLADQLSNGYHVAMEAANLVREKIPTVEIRIFNSLTAAVPEGFIAVQAAKEARAGGSMDQVEQRATEVRENQVGLAAALETLTYLARGGRIGRATSFLGSLIQIKPIVSVAKDGVVSPIDRAHSWKDAFERMIKYVRTKTEGMQVRELAILHADALERGEELEEAAVSALRPARTFFADFTPVMGAHTGPGLVGLAFYAEPPSGSR